MSAMLLSLVARLIGALCNMTYIIRESMSSRMNSRVIAVCRRLKERHCSFINSSHIPVAESI